MKTSIVCIDRQTQLSGGVELTGTPETDLTIACGHDINHGLGVTFQNPLELCSKNTVESDIRLRREALDLLPDRSWFLHLHTLVYAWRVQVVLHIRRPAVYTTWQPGRGKFQAEIIERRHDPEGVYQ